LTAQIARLLHRIDLGGAFVWERGKDSGVEYVNGQQRLSGREALARLMLYHPTLLLVLYGLAAIQEPARRWAALVALAADAYAAVVLVRSRLSPRERVPA
jgi:hypothetical protein